MNPFIGIGPTITRRRGGGGVPSFITKKGLYWGAYADISGGQMPNRLGSDYLTIAGSTGSETYTCPNTSDYLNADTDNIWYNSADVRQDVTTANLIGYDFSKTLIKYDDDSPYQIREIFILKNGETLSAYEINQAHRYFRLPLFWSDSLNAYGYLKGNRGFAKSVWPGYASEYFLNKTTGDEYAYVADNGALDVKIATGWTLLAWVRGDADPGLTVQHILGKGIGGSINGRYNVYSESADGHKITIFSQMGVSVAWKSSTKTMTDGNWHFILITYRTDLGRIEGWVDNTLVGSRAYSTQYNLSSVYEFYLGAGNTNGGGGVDYISKCKIAKVAIYPFYINQTDATAIYNGGAYPSGYTAKWDLDAYPLVDKSGNFNLTSVNLSASNIQQTPSIP